jgi:hypothetical protein
MGRYGGMVTEIKALVERLKRNGELEKILSHTPRDRQSRIVRCGSVWRTIE